LKLGKTVAELLASLDARELAEWQVFASIEPFGEERDDLRAGQVCATVANVNRAKGGKVLKATDFLLYREPQTGDDHIRTMKLWAALYG
jgi:hypothetical protein